MECDNCDKEATYVGPCPYTEEIHGELVEVSLCEDCYQESCMDI